MLTKIIQGEVHQAWEKQSGDWVCTDQWFKAYDQVDWEDQDGKVPCFMPMQEHPCDMVAPEKIFIEGQIVRIDSDNKEWGRICSDGRVITSSQGCQEALVEVFDIRANVLVPYSEMFYKDS